MKKLIEMTQDNLIECDNKFCDFKIPNDSKNPNVDTLKYVNMPCPKCGKNLLTYKDYLDYNHMIDHINVINKWFGWIAYFIPSKYETKTTVKVHNGINIIK
jgi:hypothetical protein